MADLNDKIIAYLTVNNIVFTADDYMTGQPAGEQDQILEWNEAALGPIPTQEQLDNSYAIYSVDQIKVDNKNRAAQLLTATDWTAIASVGDPLLSNPYLVNQAEFLSYRSAVRAIAVNPPQTYAVFPDVPTEQWSS